MSFNKSILNDIATAIRSLSIDAIEAANSGHPGLPLGCAEIAAYLYGHALNHNPKNPDWLGRDRFVLSAGHGSMLLYASMHLAGFDLPLEQVKNFRQMGSPTAGHPEYGHIPGIEATTGPLGQGVAMAAGLALGQEMGAEHNNLQELLTGHIVALAGDGCLMEGVSAEASSLAGHLGLGRLIVFYDANDICLDGRIDECFTEDVAKRYEAYGWQVLHCDGHNYDEIHASYEAAKAETAKPTLIVAKTIIGQGSPNRAGSNEAHGKALGEDEAKLTKEALGIPVDQPFYVPETVTQFFAEKLHAQAATEAAWQERYTAWATNNVAAAARIAAPHSHPSLTADLAALEIPENKATRQSSNTVLQQLLDTVPNLVGGSADLSCSDSTMMKNGGIVASHDFKGRNIKYGVREFAMSAMANGIALFGLEIPFIGTFMTFSDYMKNGIRLAAIMNLKVIYQFTHDSIFLGEDGPTHQPIEHLASLRSIPNLTVIRPANANEVKGAWETALTVEGPVALILTRQGVSDAVPTKQSEVSKGAYVLTDNSNGGAVDVCLMATGSEVTLAYETAQQLMADSLNVRLVSFPSFECFETQSDAYKREILGGDVQLYASIEAQSSFGWHKYVGRDGLTFSVDNFGQSGTLKDLANHYGFTPDAVSANIKKALSTVAS